MSDIPGFDKDEKLEDLLSTPVAELDEDTRTKLQRYKARKLKARRDAGQSTDRPEWWQGSPAPQTAEFEFGEQVEAEPETDTKPEDQPETETESTPTDEEETSPEPSENGKQHSESQPASPEQTSSAPQKPRARAPKREGLPQIGWSSEGNSGEPKQEILDEPEPAPTGTQQPSPDSGESSPEQSENGQPGDAESESTETPTQEASTEPAPSDSSETTEESDNQTSEPAEVQAGDRGDVEVPEVDYSDLTGLEHDPELDELLTKSVGELDEEQRIKVQRYKARILKAKRDAGESTGKPEWWAVDDAPEITEETDQEGIAEGDVATRSERLQAGGTEQSAETGEQTSEAEPDSTEEQPEASDETEADEETTEQASEPAEEPEQAEESEPELDPEDLGENPTEDELIRAGIIDEAVKQEDSQGIFRTAVDDRKCYISYTRRSKFLTLHHFELPDTLEDPKTRGWIKDLLARTAYEFAKENELIVIPQRADLREEFLSRHPEYRELTREPQYT